MVDASSVRARLRFICSELANHMQVSQVSKLQSLFMNAWNFGGRRNVRTIILTLICHYSGMNGKVVFSIPFLLDQEVILLRHSLLMDQVPVFLPMEPRLAPYGRPL